MSDYYKQRLRDSRTANQALGESLDEARAEVAALREVIAAISSAAINPALDRNDKLDLVQSILIDWHLHKSTDAAKGEARSE